MSVNIGDRVVIIADDLGSWDDPSDNLIGVRGTVVKPPDDGWRTFIHLDGGMYPPMGFADHEFRALKPEEE